MNFDVFNGKSKVRTLEVSKVWDTASGKCVHQVVVARLANERQGTHSTLTKSEVAGTGAKPFKQKGMGRSRRGSFRSPLLRGGGVTFGPKPRDYRQHINKKQKANAYLFLLKSLYEKGALKVVESLNIVDNKTKSFQAMLEGNLGDVAKRVVVVDADYNPVALQGVANIPKVVYFGVDYMDVLPIFYANQVLITEAALKKIDEKYTRILAKRGE
ncbi:MAG: 50S ribosomal protein L4 [Brevinema sp.]